MLKLQSQYEKQIIECIGNFKLRYDKILHQGEFEKRELVIKLARILEKNFDEIGILEMVKNDISSIIMNILTNQNVISISSRYVNYVLTPLGFTNIRGKYKNNEQVKDENRAIKELHSSVIYTNNVVKDLTIYNQDIKERITSLETEEYTYYNDKEILELKDSIMNVYGKINESINSRTSLVSIEQQLQQAEQIKEEEILKEKQPEKYETIIHEKKQQTQKQLDNSISNKKSNNNNNTDNIPLNKIDSPKSKPEFENLIPSKIAELKEQYKIYYKNLDKYEEVTTKYPEYNKEYHDKFVDAINSRIEFMKAENEYIRPSVNLKFRRDPISWVEILEISNDLTAGAASSRSRVPATYYDETGKLITTYRRVTKEHIEENLPYAKQMKKLIATMNIYWMAIHENYIRNEQQWTNGFSVKNHDKNSNSA